VTTEETIGGVSSKRAGRGAALILLHSLLTDRGVFDRVVPALASEWTVHAIDLPGFGSTPAVAPTIDAYADVVGAVLEDGGFDPTTTAILGNGLGAFVALGAAVRHGDRFDRLVLVGCGAAFPPPTAEAFPVMAAAAAGGGMEAVVERALARIFPRDYIESHPEEADERRRVLLNTRPEVFAAACRALAAVDYSIAARSVGNPTLIVVGSEDTATSPAMAEQLHALIGGSQMIRLEGLGHGPQLQDPARFVTAVGPFLGMDGATTRREVDR
jgi:pimeloyl-ACP methyl ester carboxylesterase